MNSLAHTRWMCKYHIVFTPKYRRKIIYYELRKDIQDIIRKLCQWKGVEIIEGHMMPDHIHLLVSIPPKYSVTQFMGYLKGKSAIWLEHSESQPSLDGWQFYALLGLFHATPLRGGHDCGRAFRSFYSHQQGRVGMGQNITKIPGCEKATGDFGADNQIRTGDLILTKDVLYHLSHISKQKHKNVFIGDPERARTVDL